MGDPTPNEQFGAKLGTLHRNTPPVVKIRVNEAQVSFEPQP